jgi:hypothetical protein
MPTLPVASTAIAPPAAARLPDSVELKTTRLPLLWTAPPRPVAALSRRIAS